jgi:integrase
LTTQEYDETEYKHRAGIEGKYTPIHDTLVYQLDHFLKTRPDYALQTDRNKLIFFSIWINQFYGIEINPSTINEVIENEEFISTKDESKITETVIKQFFDNTISERDFSIISKRSWRDTILYYLTFLNRQYNLFNSLFPISNDIFDCSIKRKKKCKKVSFEIMKNNKKKTLEYSVSKVNRGPKERFPPFYDPLVFKLDAFLDRYKSETNRSSVRNKLIFFSIWINQFYGIDINPSTVKEVIESQEFISLDDQSKVRVEELIKYFKYVIDKKEVYRSTKRSERSKLNSYFDFIEKYKLKFERDKSFINPVPSKDFFSFSDKKMTLKDIEKREEILTYDIVENVLNRLFFTDKRLFIIVSLLLYTGARISEIISIKLENIDYEERFFMNEIKGEKDRVGIYFFPKFFIQSLKDYIFKIVEVEYPNTKYLFPSRYKRYSYGQDNHLTITKIEKDLRDLRKLMNIKSNINPHSFRDLINSERFDTEMKEKYRFLLLNHTPPNVNVMSYLKNYKLRMKLQKKYDQFFPFPKFNPKINLF